MFRRERTSAEGERQMSPLTPARRPWTVDEQKKLDDLMEAGKDRRRDSDSPSADTSLHLFAVTAPLQEAGPASSSSGLKAKK
jgi:hypothetical protein